MYILLLKTFESHEKPMSVIREQRPTGCTCMIICQRVSTLHHCFMVSTQQTVNHHTLKAHSGGLLLLNLQVFSFFQ